MARWLRVCTVLEDLSLLTNTDARDSPLCRVSVQKHLTPSAGLQGHLPTRGAHTCTQSRTHELYTDVKIFLKKRFGKLLRKRSDFEDITQEEPNKGIFTHLALLPVCLYFTNIGLFNPYTTSVMQLRLFVT